MDKTAIVWLRRDLRLHDNPALTAAIARGGRVLVLFILDEAGDRWRPGGASRWWLHHSLAALDASLRRRGGRLVLRHGAAHATLDAVIAESGADAVYWNRRYDPRARALDASLKSRLRERGLAVESSNASLLFEPWTIATASGGPFKVFSPFWRACLGAEPPPPLAAPRRVPAPDVTIASDSLESWHLLPTTPDWAGGLRATWTPGEDAAIRRLADFLDDQLARYREERDRPDLDSTSRLSPHLAWGEIGPRQIWHAANHAAAAGHARPDKFLAELAWREFSWHQLYHTARCPTRTCDASSITSRGQVTRTTCAPGRPAAPAIRSSMPACASYGAPAGCTTACACWRRASW